MENVAILSKGIKNSVKIDLPTHANKVEQTYSGRLFAADNVIDVDTVEGVEESFLKRVKQSRK